MKKIMKHNFLLSGIKSLGVLLSISLAFASCANDDVAQNPSKPKEESNKNLMAFVAGDTTKTRTTLDYQSGDFFWEAGDYIYVRDDNGVLQRSRNVPTKKEASFKFMVPGKFTDHETYKVYYLGRNHYEDSRNKRDTASIPRNVVQQIPGATEHYGVTGDFGTATAIKKPCTDQFEFKLEHQPAYLVFQPYTSNKVLKNCYLTKIEVNSDNDIAATYTINPTTGELEDSVGTGSKKIELTTRPWGEWGFKLTNETPSLSTNGAYVEIKPGTHILKVRFWVKDLVTNTEGTITRRYPAFTYESNNYYDIFAQLDVKDYAGDGYYMWDAEDHYWSGHEWNEVGGSQPTLGQHIKGYTRSFDYPRGTQDFRYYNVAFNRGENTPATNPSCVNLPNANEMTWYAAKGDPRFDFDEVWTTMGHLYKGGMWFKKKAYIEGYDKELAVDGTDWRKTGAYFRWPVTQSLPSDANADKYFYLPCLGMYELAHMANPVVCLLWGIGRANDPYHYPGFYWSSTGHPKGGEVAIALKFDSRDVKVQGEHRTWGCRVSPSFQ